MIKLCFAKAIFSFLLIMQLKDDIMKKEKLRICSIDGEISADVRGDL